MQRAEGGRDRERAPADFVDGMTFCAMQANISLSSSFRRRFCDSGFACTQQSCAQRDEPANVPEASQLLSLCVQRPRGRGVVDEGNEIARIHTSSSPNAN